VDFPHVLFPQESAARNEICFRILLSFHQEHILILSLENFKYQQNERTLLKRKEGFTFAVARHNHRSQGRK